MSVPNGMISRDPLRASIPLMKSTSLTSWKIRSYLLSVGPNSSARDSMVTGPAPKSLSTGIGSLRVSITGCSGLVNFCTSSSTGRRKLFTNDPASIAVLFRSSVKQSLNSAQAWPSKSPPTTLPLPKFQAHPNSRSAYTRGSEPSLEILLSRCRFTSATACTL